jgi:hypothetical protein
MIGSPCLGSSMHSGSINGPDFAAIVRELQAHASEEVRMSELLGGSE